MENEKNNLVTVGAAWIKNSKSGSEYISVSTAGKNQKTKLFLELENGDFIQVKSMMAFFTKQKKNPNSPDLQLVVDVEKQEPKQTE
jgi:uncharacterized protein (DUF736 family)